MFIPALYYQYFPLPAYPIRYAVWIALGWIVSGIVIAAFRIGVTGPSVPPAAEPA